MSQAARPYPLSIPPGLLLAYSQASLTRGEMAEQIGEPVSFGHLLGELQRAGLPLPRIPSDRNSLGVRLIKDLTEQAMTRAG